MERLQNYEEAKMAQLHRPPSGSDLSSTVLSPYRSDCNSVGQSLSPVVVPLAGRASAGLIERWTEANTTPNELN